MKSEVQLFPYQQQVLDDTKGFNRVAYYLDMGLGKTFVGSEKMKLIDCRRNIVICQKSKITDWVDHFKAFYDCRIYDLTKKKDYQNFLHDPIHPTVLTIGIINYDLAFRRSDLLDLGHFTMLLDESSMIQNNTAKRTKFILKMNADNVILLSGTPTSGKYENLISQMHLLGWNISDELYNRQYVNWVKVEQDGFIHKVISKDDPYRNVDRLKSKMREHGAVFMKTEEVIDLPEQVMIPIKVPVTKEYKQFRKKSIVRINDVELVGDTSLTYRMYSRMLCGQYNPYKLEAFKDLAASTKDRLIVFYVFNAELNLLKQIAEELERPISEVNGSTKDLYAYENEDDSITFIQYQAGSMGLNLQKANKMVFFTPTDMPEHFEQAKKRIHRVGQGKTCFYYLMQCCDSDSVEEEIMETLNQRKEYTDELFKECEQ